jgi:hypothetical protein
MIGVFLFISILPYDNTGLFIIKTHLLWARK